MLVVVAAVAAIAPAGAGAATVVGSTFNPAGSSCDANWMDLQTASASDLYAVPSAGVLTSWSFQAGASQVPTLKLIVARATADPDEFFTVGRSDLETPVAGALNTFTDISIPVQAGDFLGMRRSSFGDCGDLSGGAGYVSRYSPADPAPSTTFGIPALAVDDMRLDVSATFEADCDADGLGDETEDMDLSACSPVVVPPVVTPPTSVPLAAAGPMVSRNRAPSTSLRSTKVARRKVTLRFASNEAGSTFLCKLDKKAFASCKSPKTYKNLKPGAHRFQVKARDSQAQIGLPTRVKKFTIKG